MNLRRNRWRLIRRESYMQLRAGKLWITRIHAPGDYRWTLWVGRTRLLPRPTHRLRYGK